ncbi:MAG: signal peptide peptidase SppA [Sorangiineae bacterium]|nr:signal peptide peptidase SppA [Polyangiaceae bacterium]MEB2324915.1 signal peptide peptidase SppA [Sorangiineae bacterium]
MSARSSSLALALGAALFATLGVCGVARAQAPLARPERLPALGRGVAGTDDTTALAANPANLAFLPGAELRWSGLFLPERDTVPWQGHAFAFGFPIRLLSLSTGLRVDVMSPPDAARAGGFSAAYQWLTWGLAFGSDAAALGVSLQRSYSDAPSAHGLASWSAAWSLRPWNGLGLSLVAHDLNAPRSQSGYRLAPAFELAAAVRPLGTRALELGLEGKYLDEGNGVWVPRATLGVDLPPFGRLRGDFAMSDPASAARRAWTASAALAIYLSGPGGSMEVSGGGVTGTGLGARGSYGLETGAAFRGFREPAGQEAPRSAVRVRIEDTPSNRGHVALLERLWELADDEPTVDAVVLELRSAPGSSLAHVEELRDAIQHLRARGKRVLCHLEDAGGSELYLCAAASRTLMNPAGGLRFAGLRMQHLYFAGLLEKLGIRADFVRIGAHKSAPEQFTRDGASDVARADTINLLQQYELEFMRGVAAGRRLGIPALRERIAQGPFIAQEARAAGLVDGFAFDDELEAAVDELVGRPTTLLDDAPSGRAPERFGRGRRLALVYVDGDMIDGRSRTIPLVGTRLAGSYTIAETLEKVREDSGVGAVVLRVESPGGSSMAADVMWREVALTAKVKPVVVSMGTYAASGGYYVSAPATRIFANPLTLTGSIGIFYGKADVVGLLRKLGVSVETYKTAPRADAESIYRPFTPEERQELERKVGQFYEVFLSRVAEGRHMTRKAVDELGQGRVWTGRQAQANGLVDELGGLRQALAAARALGELPDYAPIEELPPPDTTLLGRLLGLEGVHEEVTAAVPSQLLDMVRALGPFVIYPGDKPMALMELTTIEP